MSKKHNALKVKHQNCNTRIVLGKWGPHRAKIVCDDCHGAFVAWCKNTTKTNQYKENYMTTYTYTITEIKLAQVEFEEQLQMYMRHKEKENGTVVQYDYRRITHNAPNLFEILERQKEKRQEINDTLHLKQFLKNRT